MKKISLIATLILILSCSAGQPPNFKQEAETSREYAKRAKQDAKAAEREGNKDLALKLYSYESKFTEQAKKFEQAEIAYKQCQKEKASMQYFYDFGKDVFYERFWFIVFAILGGILFLWLKFGNLSKVTSATASTMISLFKKKDSPPSD